MLAYGSQVVGSAAWACTSWTITSNVSVQAGADVVTARPDAPPAHRVARRGPGRSCTRGRLRQWGVLHHVTDVEAAIRNLAASVEPDAHCADPRSLTQTIAFSAVHARAPGD
jgi:hypothetical protein